MYYLCRRCSYHLYRAKTTKGRVSVRGFKRPKNYKFRATNAMLLAAVAVMNTATYFPEFVKANTASGLIFSMIFRKPKTGDCRVGEKNVRVL